MLVMNLAVQSVHAADNTAAEVASRATALLERLKNSTDRDILLWRQALDTEIDAAFGTPRVRSLLIDALIYDAELDDDQDIRRHTAALESFATRTGDAEAAALANLFSQYNKSLIDNDYDAAFAGLTRGIEGGKNLDSMSIQAIGYTLRGLIQGGMGRFLPALDDLNRVVQLDIGEARYASIRLLRHWALGFLESEFISAIPAIEQFDRALTLAEDHDLPVDIVTSLYNVGDLLVSFGATDEAFEYFQFYLDYVTEKDWPQEVVVAHFGLAKVFVAKRDFDRAHHHIIQADGLFARGTWFDTAIKQVHALTLAKRGDVLKARELLAVEKAYFDAHPAMAVPMWRLRGVQARAEIDVSEGHPGRALDRMNDILAELNIYAMTRASENFGLIQSELNSEIDIREQQAELAALKLREQGLFTLLITVISAFLMLVIIGLMWVRHRLTISRDNAKAASQHKTDFLANVGHEIRTPLSGISGTLDLLETAQSTEERRELIRLSQAANCSLQAVINDLLDVSRMEAGILTITPEPSEPGAIIEDVVALFRSEANTRGLDLSADVQGLKGRRFMLDPDRLRQIVSNLVSNGLKYTDAGSVRAALDLGSADDGGDILIFTVTDTGKGLTAAEQEQIFSRFARAAAAKAERISGVGLGLSIVTQLVALMKGSVSVTSEPGAGSCFRVEIPTVAAASEARPQVVATVAAPTAPSLCVLVAEDVELNQILIRKLLSRHGHEAYLVGNGAEAVSAFEADMAGPGRFDAVFMDLRMPVMDGLEASRKIRALGGRGGRVPIIAVTANAYQDTHESCLAAGMTGFIAKPLDGDDVVNTLTASVAAAA